MVSETHAGVGDAMISVFHIAVCRKPLEGTVAQNVSKYGVGGLNIEGTRIATSGNEPDSGAMYYKNRGLTMPANRQNYFRGKDSVVTSKPIDGGRWPANLILVHNNDCVRKGIKKVKGARGGDGKLRKAAKNTFNCCKEIRMTEYVDKDNLETVEDWECVEGCPVRVMDEQSGVLRAGWYADQDKGESFKNSESMGKDNRHPTGRPSRSTNDAGGASRFFKRIVT